MRNLMLCLFFVMVNISLFGQVKLGEWREHLPYRKAKQVIASEELIFCLTQSGLFSYSLQDNEIIAYSKTRLLSESEIASIAWSEDAQSLLVGYTSGNLDILSNGKIKNIPDIKRFALAESKKINAIATNGNTAYVGTDFGIVAVNLEKKEIADTYFIGNNAEKLVVQDIEISSGEIWAATSQGIFKSGLDSGNLSDFNNWEHIQDIPDHLKACKELLAWNGKLLAVRKQTENSDELVAYENGVWSNFSGNFQHIHSLKTINTDLWVVQASKLRIFSTGNIEKRSVQIDEKDDFRDVAGSKGRIFVADHQKSLLEFTGNQKSVLKPDGPLNQKITNFYSVGEQTWAVAGSYNEFYQGQGLDAELYLFEDQGWLNFSKTTTPELNGSFDLFALTGDQQNESIVYAGSWNGGVFVFEDKKLQTFWNTSNSPLGGQGVRGMASDREGNLWILDANSPAALKVRTRNDEWFSLSYPGIANRSDFRKLIVLNNGDKWVLMAPDKALFACNENKSISNRDDDVSSSFFVRDENNSIISSRIYDVIQDKNGRMWLGTENGIAIYSEPENLFGTDDFFAFRPIISIDGSTQYLLGTEKVLSIAVDGANQKWLGTENSGVFLVSENADEQLLHFTSENSPLPSNTVKKISVNPKTGEVFFATAKGMISYKGSVTKGEENFNNLYVYPNPVRETYHDNIVVSGLMEDSSVKITDVSGNLVMQGKSAGGQFVWDGKNGNGSRVHTGVYLIFCSNSDGTQSKVIKLLFIH